MAARMSASAYRCEPRPDRNGELRERIQALAQRHKRYGVGMIHLGYVCKGNHRMRFLYYPVTVTACLWAKRFLNSLVCGCGPRSHSSCARVVTGSKGRLARPSQSNETAIRSTPMRISVVLVV